MNEAGTDLDEKVKVAAVVVTAGGRVATHDILAIDLSRDRYVLANREAENVIGVGESEPVADAAIQQHACERASRHQERKSNERTWRY